VSVDIVIDLDRGEPPAPAARRRRRIRLDPRLLLAPSLLLVLLVPASAAHRPGLLAQVFTAVASPDAAPMIHNGVLYVGDGATMTAYRLVDGRRLWRAAAGEGQTEPGGTTGAITKDALSKPRSSVAVQIGGRSAEVLYAGSAPDLPAGVIQVNARIPDGVRRGADVPVVLMVGEASSPASNSVSIKP